MLELELKSEALASRPSSPVRHSCLLYAFGSF